MTRCKVESVFSPGVPKITDCIQEMLFRRSFWTRICIVLCHNRQQEHNYCYAVNEQIPATIHCSAICKIDVIVAYFSRASEGSIFWHENEFAPSLTTSMKSMLVHTHIILFPKLPSTITNGEAFQVSVSIHEIVTEHQGLSGQSLVECLFLMPILEQRKHLRLIDSGTL